MQTATIPFEETHCFSKAFLAYISGDQALQPFYRASPSIENVGDLIKTRSFSKEQRSVLSKALQQQYGEQGVHAAVSANIRAIEEEKTFTITTGHQLNIFTGPLYFIYKIVTVINTCKALKKEYPDHTFVPVYWMASEDHDFEEISYFHFEGKKITWETNQQGAVGRFNPNGLQEIAAELPQGAAFFDQAYSADTLADAARSYVNHLFEDEGLLVVDADDPQLKQQLAPVMEDDLFQNNPEQLVNAASSQLEENGFKPLVHPRNINFFYLKDNVRERIERAGDDFEVVGADLRFSAEEIKTLIAEHPERFSPNVILRPLYQEMILPNLAYVGGPSELVYWLQLKPVFEHFKVPFPALMPRNFALICSKNDLQKWSNAGLQQHDLFVDVEKTFAKWVGENTLHDLNYAKELEQLAELEQSAKGKADNVDPTLVQHIEALHANFAKKIATAEKKLLRAEKRKHSEKRQQIEAVKEVLFPGGTLQERKVNFLNFYLKDPAFIQKLKSTFDPFLYEMYLLSE